MTPDLIDDIIHDEIRKHKSALQTIKREQEFAEKKVAELYDCLDCDHEREMVNGVQDKCRHCGFVWVRR